MNRRFDLAKIKNIQEAIAWMIEVDIVLFGRDSDTGLESRIEALEIANTKKTTPPASFEELPQLTIQQLITYAALAGIGLGTAVVTVLIKLGGG